LGDSKSKKTKAKSQTKAEILDYFVVVTVYRLGLRGILYPECQKFLSLSPPHPSPKNNKGRHRFLRGKKIENRKWLHMNVKNS
jgi:hypothetical protein